MYQIGYRKCASSQIHVYVQRLCEWRGVCSVGALSLTRPPLCEWRRVLDWRLGSVWPSPSHSRHCVRHALATSCLTPPTIGTQNPPFCNYWTKSDVCSGCQSKPLLILKYCTGRREELLIQLYDLLFSFKCTGIVHKGDVLYKTLPHHLGAHTLVAIGKSELVRVILIPCSKHFQPVNPSAILITKRSAQRNTRQIFLCRFVPWNCLREIVWLRQGWG